MSTKLTSTFENYKYLYKSNFYISKKQYFILILLNIFNLSASFATVFASLPFLDFILAKNPDEYQKITNYGNPRRSSPPNSRFWGFLGGDYDITFKKKFYPIQN